MKKAIWKFQLAVQDEFTCSMLVGARILHVATQKRGITETAYMWAEVDIASSAKEDRHFFINGTGRIFADTQAERGVYVGTFIIGRLVSHVYEAVTP